MKTTVHEINSNMTNHAINVFAIQDILGDSSITQDTELVICRADKLLNHIEDTFNTEELVELTDKLLTVNAQRALLIDLSKLLDRLSHFGLEEAVIGNYTITSKIKKEV